MTRTGRILAIETKGEMLKGDDSRDKLSLGNMWANAVGDGYPVLHGVRERSAGRSGILHLEGVREIS